jgi:hypothetical protein
MTDGASRAGVEGRSFTGSAGILPACYFGLKPAGRMPALPVMVRLLDAQLLGAANPASAGEDGSTIYELVFAFTRIFR